MKKILKLSLVLTVVLITVYAHAVGVDFSKVEKNGQKKMVTLALNDMNKIELSIYDENNKLIHEESVTSKGKFIKKYDLNALPEGVYVLVAESNAKITKYEILVVKESATIMSDPLSEVNKSVAVK